jgi:hypothetical protein
MIEWLKTFVSHPVVTHVFVGVLGILFGVFITLIIEKMRRWYQRAGEIRFEPTELEVKTPVDENCGVADIEYTFGAKFYNSSTQTRSLNDIGVQFTDERDKQIAVWSLMDADLGDERSFVDLPVKTEVDCHFKIKLDASVTTGARLKIHKKMLHEMLDARRLYFVAKERPANRAFKRLVDPMLQPRLGAYKQRVLTSSS